jgi:hypothetical protein
MIRALAASAAATTAIVLTSLSAFAASQDGALVGLHDLRREGGKTCMSDHAHSGSSNGQPTRARAELEAQRSWSSFTALEYGGHWGSPALASSRGPAAGHAISKPAPADDK